MRKVGIVIPCYKASGLINKVVEKIINTTITLQEDYIFNIYIIDDYCPEQSWREVKKNKMIKILKLYLKMVIMQNLDGLGAEIFHTLTGLVQKHRILFVPKLKKKRKIKRFCQHILRVLELNLLLRDL